MKLKLDWTLVAPILALVVLGAARSFTAPC